MSLVILVLFFKLQGSFKIIFSLLQRFLITNVNQGHCFPKIGFCPEQKLLNFFLICDDNAYIFIKYSCAIAKGLHHQRLFQFHNTLGQFQANWYFQSFDQINDLLFPLNNTLFRLINFNEAIKCTLVISNSFFIELICLSLELIFNSGIDDIQTL